MCAWVRIPAQKIEPPKATTRAAPWPLNSDRSDEELEDNETKPSGHKLLGGASFRGQTAAAEITSSLAYQATLSPSLPSLPLPPIGSSWPPSLCREPWLDREVLSVSLGLTRKEQRMDKETKMAMKIDGNGNGKEDRRKEKLWKRPKERKMIIMVTI